MMHVLSRTAPSVVIALVPLAVAAQSFNYLDDLADESMGVIRLAVPLLITLALVFFLWGLVMFIAQADNEQARTAGKQKMVWGIIALFVIVSVWGLVTLLQGMVGADEDIGTITTPIVPN